MISEGSCDTEDSFADFLIHSLLTLYIKDNNTHINLSTHKYIPSVGWTGQDTDTRAGSRGRSTGTAASEGVTVRAYNYSDWA